jgi:Spherulation-specific family 4
MGDTRMRLGGRFGPTRAERIVFPPRSACGERAGVRGSPDFERTLKRAINRIVAIVLLASVAGHPVPAQQPKDEKPPRPAALVPAYFYPSGKGLKAWQQLTKDARSVRIEVILNPASGPGRRRDPTFATVASDFRKAGGRILGYISTNYGKRDITRVERDLRSYLAFYEIDGIFLDEMPDSKTALPYYQKVHHLIKELKPELKIVGNAGQPFVDEGYMKTVDCLVLFEGRAELYAEYHWKDSTPWMDRYPADRFANIVHSVATPAGMRRAMRRAADSRAGWAFITNRKMPNPYDGLPDYWAEETEDVAPSAFPE